IRSPAELAHWTEQLHRFAQVWIDFEENRVPVRARQSGQEEPGGVAVQERTQHIATERTVVLPLERANQIVHVILHVARDFAWPKGQRVQLLGGRVGEDEDGLGDGVVERRSAREALQL